MKANRYAEYLEEELKKTYAVFFARLREDYIKKYYSEMLAYKKSGQYKSIKNNAYWSRPKDEIDKEALAEQMAKLGYWVPWKRNYGIHTSYSGIDEIEDAKADWEHSIDFKFAPSITEEEFFVQEATTLESLIGDQLLGSIASDLAEHKTTWEKPPLFVSYCSKCEQSKDGIADFLVELQKIMKYLSERPIPEPSLSRFQRETKNKASIVVNGRKVMVDVLGQNKMSSFNVDIAKYEAHTALLGLKVGDTFQLPGIGFTYKIKEIWDVVISMPLIAYLQSQR